MIDAEKISALLAEQQALLSTLAGRKVGGFFIIVPPEGEPITQLLLGTDPSAQEFYKAIATRCAEGQKVEPVPGRYIGGVR